MQPIEFTVPAVPVAQPRQRTAVHQGTVMNYTPSGHPVQSFKATCRLAAHQAYDGPPLEGPIGLEVTFILPRRQGLIYKSKPMPRVRHTSSPDLDNLEKAVKDALTGLVWRDDSQICEVVKDKWIASGSEQPHVVITIWSISKV